MSDDAVTFSVKNRNRVLFILRRIGPELKAETERESNKIARRFIGDTRRAARTPREHAVVSSATVRKAPIPKVAFGGSVLLATSEPVQAYRLFWGTEFGGHIKRYWRPWGGKTGYVLYPTLRSHGREYAGLWIKAIEKTLDKAARQSERASRG